MCRAPARLAGFDRKGAVEVGYDADLVVWDPEGELTVDGRSLMHRHPLTPYEGRALRGVVERTYLARTADLRTRQTDERAVGPALDTVR